MALAKKYKTLAITTGDQDGIGVEVACKALNKIGAIRGCRYLLFSQKTAANKKYLNILQKKFDLIEVGTAAEALAIKKIPPYTIIHIVSQESPAHWVQSVAKHACNSAIDGLITAPLSKTLIQQSGLSDMGHTGILSRVSHMQDLFMSFTGHHFNVLLATGHIPFDQVPQALTKKRLNKAIAAAQLFLRSFKDHRPIGLVGLNPHAGEDGLIGSFEKRTLHPLLRQWRKQGISVSEPLVPDAAFLHANWKKYGIFLSLYHDQGLIAFKTVHQHAAGCHLTIGLPFVRTSVEHGTAKDLFGKNKANDQSMTDAILTCAQLVKNNYTLSL